MSSSRPDDPHFGESRVVEPCHEFLGLLEALRHPAWRPPGRPCAGPCTNPSSDRPAPRGDHGVSSRLEHTMELGQRAVQVGEELEREAAQHEIERGVRELQLLGVHPTRLAWVRPRRSRAAPAARTISPDGSIPIAWPRGPTCRAAGISAAPCPQATSRTWAPADGRASAPRVARLRCSPSRASKATDDRDGHLAPR